MAPIPQHFKHGNNLNVTDGNNLNVFHLKMAKAKARFWP